MIQVRRSTYHDKPGWSVVGHPPDGGVFGVSIWVHHETTARQIAALYKVTPPRDDLAIDRLIREEPPMKTYQVEIVEYYVVTVEADSKKQAVEIAEETDRDTWDLYDSVTVAYESPSGPSPPIDATIRKV